MSRHTDRTAPRHDAPSTGGERTGGAPPRAAVSNTLRAAAVSERAVRGARGSDTLRTRTRSPRLQVARAQNALLPGGADLSDRPPLPTQAKRARSNRKAKRQAGGI